MVKLNFRGFSHMEVGQRRNLPQMKEVFVTDSLVEAVFAPDPATGMPCAGAMLQLENGTFDPAVKEMLRQKFCQPVSGSLLGSEDKDAVIAYTKTQNEKLDAYIERLTSDIESHAKEIHAKESHAKESHIK